MDNRTVLIYSLDQVLTNLLNPWLNGCGGVISNGGLRLAVAAFGMNTGG